MICPINAFFKQLHSPWYLSRCGWKWKNKHVWCHGSRCGSLSIVFVVGFVIVTVILQGLVMCVLSVFTGSQIHCTFGPDTWVPGRKSDEAVKFPGRRYMTCCWCWSKVEHKICIFVPICLVWEKTKEKHNTNVQMTWGIQPPNLQSPWQECFVDLLQICECLIKLIFSRSMHRILSATSQIWPTGRYNFLQVYNYRQFRGNPWAWSSSNTPDLSETI